MNDPEAHTASEPTTGCPGWPVCVLGMDRSGTSMVASMVHRWGAYGGDETSLRAGNEGNPRGYFENRKMQAFLVERLGAEFWVEGYEQRLRELAEQPEVRADALELMDEMSRGGDVWFWKEPLLSVTLPFWEPLWADRVAYLVLVRDPWKCARSWQKLSLPPAVRDRVDLQAAGLLRWQLYMLSILKIVENGPWSLFIQYEDVLASPGEQARRLAGFLDGWSRMETTPQERLRGMTEIVEPTLDRTGSSIEFIDRDQATADQKYLWDVLRQKARDCDVSVDLDRSAPWPGWREYLGNLREFWLLYERSACLLQSRWAARAEKLERLLKAPVQLWPAWRRSSRRA